jgi:DNA polymerase III epsilon subunit-like protein
MDEHLMRFDKTKELVFIDFETENLCLYLSRNLPWQAAMLRVRGNNVLETYNQYLKWERPFNVSPGAALATHYDAAKVERLGVPAAGVVEKIVDWTEKADHIIGHNILGFDIYFLIKFYEKCGKSIKGLAEKIIDTHPLAKGVKLTDPFDSKKSSLLEYQYRMIHTIAKGVKTNTLTLGTEYGIQHDYGNLHDAMVDLQLLIKIWNHMKFLVEI